MQYLLGSLRELYAFVRFLYKRILIRSTAICRLITRPLIQGCSQRSRGRPFEGQKRTSSGSTIHVNFSLYTLVWYHSTFCKVSRTTKRVPLPLRENRVTLQPGRLRWRACACTASISNLTIAKQVARSQWYTVRVFQMINFTFLALYKQRAFLFAELFDQGTASLNSPCLTDITDAKRKIVAPVRNICNGTSCLQLQFLMVKGTPMALTNYGIPII